MLGMHRLSQNKHWWNDEDFILISQFICGQFDTITFISKLNPSVLKCQEL